MKINKELRLRVYNKCAGLCAYCGKPLEDDWQVDHISPQFMFNEGYLIGDKNDFTNLLPTNKIINHYKRGLDLEGFRKYMMNFHLRLNKLPKKTNVDKTKKRIIYMNKIADLFNISVDKPFNGKFYYEE